MCVFFLASTDEQDEIFKHHGGGMLAVSFLLVLFQVATVCGVMTGTILPTCTTTYQCKMAQEEGLFCRIKSDGSDNRCMFCGDAATLRMQLVIAPRSIALLVFARRRAHIQRCHAAWQHNAEQHHRPDCMQQPVCVGERPRTDARAYPYCDLGVVRWVRESKHVRSRNTIPGHDDGE
jgi:hypothetical protein